MQDYSWVEQIVKNQSDLSNVQFIKEQFPAVIFKAKQTVNGTVKRQYIQVVIDNHNHFVLQREKDILCYLNQFEDSFPRFNEVRKYKGCYLYFFDYVGKKYLKNNAGLEFFNSNMAFRLMSDMLSTLDKVHGVGFVHSQIRPENILLGKNKFYLMGWHQAMPGLASYETENMGDDHLYTAPERMNGVHHNKSDIYQLGCTLYYAFTGKHIYKLNKVPSLFDQLYAHAFHSPKKLNLIPVFWRQLILWMVDKSPENRPTLSELNQWMLDKVSPKWIRKLKLQKSQSFPKDSLVSLAENHFQYANYKQAQYLYSIGEKDSAFNLYENLSFQGYSRASFQLGKFYQQGILVKQSSIRALNMYHQSFEKGNPLSAFSLGTLFDKAIGVPENPVQAYKLYRFSAMRGYAPAQRFLGLAYYTGRGVQKDLVQARFWIGIAAKYGDEVAKILLKRFVARNQTMMSVQTNRIG